MTPPPSSPPALSSGARDDKGYSEEACVRCGWTMGSPPLNCQNDDTPHRFPSQMLPALPSGALAEEVRELLPKTTPGPWYPFNVDDDHAMNCHGVSTDPDFERNEDYLSGGEADDAPSRRIVALTLYQSKRVVCHSAGRWEEDARLIALAPEMAAEIAQLVARLEQAEQERDSAREWVSRIFATTEQEMWDERNGPDAWALSLKREYRSQLTACEHTRDDALAALTYIRQQYGELDGVGWNRLTGEGA